MKCPAPRYVDEHPADAPKARRLRPKALDPKWAMECFLDRSLDYANSQAGLFAIAYALISAVNVAFELRAVDQQRAADKAAAKGDAA